MQSKIKIGLVQINNSFSNQNYLPYSVGLFQAFVQKHLANKDCIEFLLPIYKRIPVSEAVNRLIGANIILFSVYVWNFRISLEIARQVKANNKEVIIVFGGPQIPYRQVEVFLRLNPFIDIACYGEGELIIQSIVDHYPKRNWKEAHSVSYINEAGKYVETIARGRISDLNMIPSPYNKGIFDLLVEANRNTEWIALWETNRGCPFTCTYCDWGAASKNKIYPFNIERLYKEIDWFSKNKIEFVFCCDANFGILKRDLDIVRYFIKNKQKYGYPKALSVQSTKNYTEHAYKIYKEMSDAGLSKGVSLSLQSLNEDTLIATKRKNININAFKEIQQRLTADKVETFTDIILGLPNETYDSFANGVSTVIENGQHNRIQFNNLSILPNTDMSDPEYQREFGFEVIETKIINIHGSLSTREEVPEIQHLVVGTSSTPRVDWIKTRVFGWMTALIHFDKLLQIPFIIIHNEFSLSFRELIELFIMDQSEFPVVQNIHLFFVDKAKDIQNGGAEFCQSKKWLNIWWPADELILITLCTEKNLKKFYKEAEEIIDNYLKHKGLSHYKQILHEALYLNQNLIKLPFKKYDKELQLAYNIWEVYYAALRGHYEPLKEGSFSYKMDRTSAKWSSWEDWCKEVIWWGNKKGAYIYNCTAIGKKMCQDKE